MQPPVNKYFTSMIERSKDVCQKYGIYIDFQGYDDLIEKLKNLKFGDFEKAWELSKECNAWCEYIGDCKSSVNMALLNAETDKKSIVSAVSSKADKNKVANGERLANADKDVVNIRKERNQLEALLKLLEDKQQFLIQSHYFARLTCNWTQERVMAELKNAGKIR